MSAKATRQYSNADWERMLREHAHAIGLRLENKNPFTLISIADGIRYAESRRTAKDCGMAAYADRQYIEAGYEPLSPRTIFLPGLAFRTGNQNYQPNLPTAGAELVGNNFRPDLFIDALRNRSVAMQLGAQNIGGLVGDVQIPRQVSTSSAFWLTTSGSAPVVSGPITESEALFDTSPIIAAPSQVGGFGKISRQLLLQGGELVDSVLRDDLTQVLATALDFAAIQGPGTGGSPIGIVNTPGVGTVPGLAPGGAFYQGTAISATTTLASANGILNRSTLGWTMTPAIAGLLAGRPKTVGFPLYVLDGTADGGTINGHRALSTLNAPANTTIFGDWSQVLILSWGPSAPIEIEIDHFGGGFAQGDVRYRAMLSCAVIIRHGASFVVINGVD